jgi:aspartate kinase
MDGATRRLVVKFGGSVLSSGARIAEAARLVAEAPVDERLVVVSAPQGMTDQLVGLVDGVPDAVDPAHRAALLAYGERISARLIASVLESRGVPVRLVEPEDPAWPVWTHGGCIDATIDPELSRERARALLAPLLRTHVVVVGGFLGREGDRVTTLRRGGSDTTALALASFLDASDVVLVKDVPGVLSADPNLVPGARSIPELAAGQLAELARAGARVVSPESLGFLDRDHRVRVIGFGAPLLEAEGTRLTPGPIAPSTTLAEAPVPEGPGTGAVTVVFDEWGHAFRALRESLVGVRWLSVAATPSSLTVFVPEPEVMPLMRALHASEVFKAVTSRVGLAIRTVPRVSDRVRPGEGVDPRAIVGKFELDGRVHWILSEEARSSAGAPTLTGR